MKKLKKKIKKLLQALSPFRAWEKYVYGGTVRRRRQGGLLTHLLKKLFIYGGAIALATYLWFSIGLPDIEQLNRFTRAPSIVIKAENGEILGGSGDIYGDYIGFDELPASLIDAVIATEDRNFYYHFGIDPMGLLRATVANLKAGHVVQGGSTITQQVAKNVFLTPERSFSRKMREMLLALRIERRFSKRDIMSIYLNRVYLGAGNYGVDAASRRYFGKSARELTLSESAILAGLLKAPSRFAPTSNPELSKNRAAQILKNMQAAGYLTEAQTNNALQALNQTMKQQKPSTQSSLYFVDWVLDQLPDYIGNVQEDLVVYTTLDPKWQLLGEKAIADVMDKEGESHNAAQAALLAMTPTGAIRVMIGGRKYGASQYNRVTQALRQPGSSFKVFVYLAGLEAGMTGDTLFEDEPVSVKIVGGTWYPKNYTGRYLGTIPMRLAVAESINTVAVQVSQQAGLDHVIDVAHRLGITSDIQEVPSIALGATEVTLLEMTTAYAHLASNGIIVNPYAITRIDTANGNTVYDRRGGASGIVLSRDIVAQMNDMLIGVVTSGTGRGAQIGRPMAGKTGTTSDYRDAWFMGYTPDLATGVWVGNDDNKPMKKVTGGMLPAMIWRGFMKEALVDTPAREIPTNGIASPLPWQPDLSGFGDQQAQPELSGPALDEPAPVQQEPPPQERTLKKRNADLGKSFWDKLLGPSKSGGGTKYQYPEGRP